MNKFIEGFIHRPGIHCESSALRDVFEYRGHRFSEDMIFGLSSGLGFVYWSMKRATPPVFVGGRSKELVGPLCQTLGIKISKKTTGSSQRVWQGVKGLIDKNIPVVLQVDMCYLDYYRGKVGPFGGHFIVLTGYDDEKGEAYIADMDDKQTRAKRRKNGLFVTSLKSLAEARGSRNKPFPPRNAWFTFTFPEKLTPLDEAIKAAIKINVESFLYPPIKNLCIKGIHHFADQVITWPDTISGTFTEFVSKSEVSMLDFQLFLTHVFMEKDGTGGGMFRRIYSRFLNEAGETLQDRTLKEASGLVMRSADNWTEIAEILLAARGGKPDEIRKLLAGAQLKIRECAEIEEEAFRILKSWSE